MRVESVRREDLPEIFEITHRALEKDEFFGWLNPGREKYPGDLRRNQIIRLRSRLVGLGQYGYVAVTEEGDQDWSGKPEVAGFVFLHRSAGDEASKKWRADTLFKKVERKLLDWEIWYDTKFLNRAEDPKRLAEYIKLEPWNSFTAINPRWHVGLICVSPKFQRRGVGSMLIQQAQKLATDEGLPVTLEASIVGRFLYLKSGFKVVGEVKLCEEYTDALMLWEPRGLEGTWLEQFEGDKAKMKER
ncbi:GNAT family protein [Paraphaeosphaeria sporulosa]